MVIQAPSSPFISQSETNWLIHASLSDVYQYLTGQEGTRSGRDIKFLCVNHPDADPSLFISDEKDCGHCFGCDWKFNRWQLLKEYGIKVGNNNGVNKLYYRNTVRRETVALKQLGRHSDAQKLETCATRFEVRRCSDCKATFVIPYHCDHRLCPICTRRHVSRFLNQHKDTLDYRLELWGVTLGLAGKPLNSNCKEPHTELKALIEDFRKTLAQIKRKYQPFGLFQNIIVVRQIKIKRGIAYLKIYILLDCTRKHIDILGSYLASRYKWSPIRAHREFWTIDDAFGWLGNKASKPLEEWGMPEDLATWLEATRHMPLIYGLGNFRKVRGGRGKDMATKTRKDPVACPFCGSIETMGIATVPKEEAWLWDKRLSPPEEGNQ